MDFFSTMLANIESVFKTISINDIADILIVLYVVYMFKTNLNLGIFTSVFAVFTVIVDFILGKCCNFRSFKRLLHVSNIVIFTITAYFVFDTSKLSFIFYNFAVATAGEIIRTISETNMYKISQDKSVAVHYRAEYLALRELYLNGGRIIGFLMVILVALSENNEILKYLIFLLSFMWACIGYLSNVLSQKLVENKIKE